MPCFNSKLGSSVDIKNDARPERIHLRGRSDRWTDRYPNSWQTRRWPEGGWYWQSPCARAWIRRGPEGYGAQPPARPSPTSPNFARTCPREYTPLVRAIFNFYRPLERILSFPQRNPSNSLRRTAIVPEIVGTPRKVLLGLSLIVTASGGSPRQKNLYLRIPSPRRSRRSDRGGQRRRRRKRTSHRRRRSRSGHSWRRSYRSPRPACSE